MKAIFIALTVAGTFATGAFARDNYTSGYSNSHTSGHSSGHSSQPSYSSGHSSGGSYSNPGSHSVSGYTRSDGTYVAPHHATNPDNTTSNNWSHRGNVNPYTGQTGTRRD